MSLTIERRCAVSIGLSLLLGGSACTEYKPRSLDAGVVTPALTLLPDDCKIESVDDLVGVNLPQLASGRHSLANDEELQLVVSPKRLKTNEHATVVVGVKTERGEHYTTLPTMPIGPGDNLALSVPTSQLGLPSQPLSFTGALEVTVTLELANGQTVMGAVAHASLHPDGDRWQLYGDTVRDADYAGGVLVNAARLQESAQAALASIPPTNAAGHPTPHGIPTRHVYTFARVHRVSSSATHVPLDQED